MRMIISCHRLQRDAVVATFELSINYRHSNTSIYVTSSHTGVALSLHDDLDNKQLFEINW